VLSLEKPSPVQQRAIVPLLKRRNLIMQAQSGTGKTAAFVIAILQKVGITDRVSSASQLKCIFSWLTLAGHIRQ